MSDLVFPREGTCAQSRPVRAILFSLAQPGLPSPQRDVITWQKVLTEQKIVRPEHVHIIYCHDRPAGAVANAEFALDKSAFLRALARSCAEEVKSESTIIALSGHGYGTGAFGQDYMIHPTSQEHISSFELHRAVVAGFRPDDNCLVFVDTCSSGSMFMLEHHPAYQHRPKEMNIKAREPLILQVSACLDGAGDMDDISTVGGFGGGLTSAIADHIATTKLVDWPSNGINLSATLTNAHRRMASAGQTLVFSANQPDLVHFMKNTCISKCLFRGIDPVMQPKKTVKDDSSKCIVQ